MAVGPVFTADQLRYRAANLAARRRALESETADFQGYIDRLGAYGLEQAGFTSDDAGEFLRLADVHGNLAAIYFGTAPQPEPYSFDDALEPFRGAGLNP